MNTITIFLILILVIVIIFAIFASIGSFSYGFYIGSVVKSGIFAVIISAIIIYTTLKKFNLISFIAFILLSAIFYVIFSQMRGDNMLGSLPNSTYPPPPHLGLDGISLENIYSGL